MAEWNSRLAASEQKTAWVPNREPVSGGERRDVRTEGILKSERKEKNQNRRKCLEAKYGEVVQESWDAENEA